MAQLQGMNAAMTAHLVGGGSVNGPVLGSRNPSTPISVANAASPPMTQSEATREAARVARQMAGTVVFSPTGADVGGTF